jgi:phenylacetate-CoA ligase
MAMSLIAATIKVYTLPHLPAAWQARMTEKRVIKSVRDAYYNVPFYRRKYDAAGINIDRIRTLDDMKLLPVLTREEVRRNFPGNIIRRGTDLSRCHKTMTGGSTSEPISLVISPSAYAYYLAESARIYSMIGYHFWQRSCYLRASPMSLPRVSAGRQTHISIMHPVRDQIEQIKRARPHLIDGTAGILLNLARHLTEEDRRSIAPHCITVNSEMSTESERDFISRAFNCPVYDEYGTEEVWSVATQCRRHRYHISSDSVWLEFLDVNGHDASAGEVGDILITSIRSEAMPFIRYAIGDRGSPDTGVCDCGNKFPMMKSIDGRADDWLIMPSGKWVHPMIVLGVIWKTILTHPLLLDQYRVIQTQPDTLVFRFVKGPQFEHASIDTILLDIREVFDESINVTSEEGPIERGAKRLAVQSMVPHDTGW